METTRTCEHCGAVYEKGYSEGWPAFARRRYCTMDCYRALCRSRAKGGRYNTKGIRSDETRRKMSENRRGKGLGERSANWKGDQAGVAALHIWVNRHYGPRTGVCQMCGAVPKKTHWHNIPATYLRVRADWIEVCPRCNRHEDIKMRACPHCGEKLYPDGVGTGLSAFERSRQITKPVRDRRKR